MTGIFSCKRNELFVCLCFVWEIYYPLSKYLKKKGQNSPKHEKFVTQDKLWLRNFMILCLNIFESKATQAWQSWLFKWACKAFQLQSQNISSVEQMFFGIWFLDFCLIVLLIVFICCVLPGMIISIIEDCRVNKPEQQAEPPQEKLPVQQITYPLRDEGYNSLEELHNVFLWGEKIEDKCSLSIFLFWIDLSTSISMQIHYCTHHKTPLQQRD